MKNYILLVILLSIAAVNAQSVNDYKYVIVDNQYEFQGKSNEYRLNELMEFELQKYNFETYRNNEVLPSDLNLGLCNVMYLKVFKSGTLWSDIYAHLENCEGEILFTTKTARGTEKNYEKAYFSAVRESFESFNNLNYSYRATAKLIDEPIPIVDEVSTILPQIKKPEPKELEIETPYISPSQSDPISKFNNPNIISSLSEMDYVDISGTKYSLKINDLKKTLNIYQNGESIGSGRITGAGAYLITTPSFSGIGYLKNGQFIIEYDDNGSAQRIILEK